MRPGHERISIRRTRGIFSVGDVLWIVAVGVGRRRSLRAVNHSTDHRFPNNVANVSRGPRICFPVANSLAYCAVPALRACQHLPVGMRCLEVTVPLGNMNVIVLFLWLFLARIDHEMRLRSSTTIPRPIPIKAYVADSGTDVANGPEIRG